MDHLRSACSNLVVPRLFAGSGEKIEIDVFTRRAAHAWVDTLLPQGLDELAKALDDLSTHLDTPRAPEDHTDLRCTLINAVVAAGRLAPPPGVDLGAPHNSPDQIRPPDIAPDVLGYPGSKISMTQATRIRDQAVELLTKIFTSSAASTNEEEDKPQIQPEVSTAVSLLQSYIKPLFSTPKHVKDDGRLKPVPVGIVDLKGDPSLHDVQIAEEVVWKGGGPADDSRWATSVRTTSDVDTKANDVVAQRHAGIGAVNVVAWCASVLGAALADAQPRSEAAAQASTWWSLIIPPLVTILEDSDVRVRLVGVRAAYSLLIPTSPSTDEEPRAISMLLRSGLAPLVHHALDFNLHLLDHRFSPILVWDSVLTQRVLILLTTSPAQLTNTVVDLDKTPPAVQRFDHLYHVLDHAILRVLTFLHLPHAPFALPPLTSQPSHTEEDETPSKVATMTALLSLAPTLLTDLGPGGAARSFDALSEALMGILESIRPVDPPFPPKPHERSAFLEGPLDRQPQVPFVRVAQRTVRTLRTLVQLASTPHGTAPPLVDRAEDLVASAAATWVGFELYDTSEGKHGSLAVQVQGLVRGVTRCVPSSQTVRVAFNRSLVGIVELTLVVCRFYRRWSSWTKSVWVEWLSSTTEEASKMERVSPSNQSCIPPHALSDGEAHPHAPRGCK